jgi:azurin/glucose/arabinose dehydrogenase/lysophospholipase L1-like esterase
MKHPAKLLFGLLLWTAAAALGESSQKPASSPGILFYGGSLVERLMEGGDLEAYLQLAQPKAGLRVRSLAWTGDEIGNRFRPEGYAEHLKTLLAKWPVETVVLGFGNNEAFAGEPGVEQFKKDWEIYLREIRRLHPDAKLVLLSPVAVQASPGVDLEARNRQIEAYTRVIQEVAQTHGALFVDLFSATRKAYAQTTEPLTTYGIHLNEKGARIAAEVIARRLLGDAAVAAADPARVREVAQAASRKAGYVAEVVRPKNGVVYYGGRKRQEENDAEIPRYHALIEQADETVHTLASHPEKKFSDVPPPTLPPLPEGKSVPDRYSGGVLKEPAEQQKDLVVADGYALNLFASEAEFPELKNPVQIAFDARGRLWVVTMPSFPHTLPGEQPDDKILILEDSDRDGKADRCTVFAGGFDALDGVAFHEKGVIVSAQPRLLLLKDTDGDGRADTREELLRGVDVTDSHHGGMIGVDTLGQVIFSDGVFHRSQFETPFGVVRSIDSTTYRMNLHTGRVLSEWQSQTPNPWKPTLDRYGNLFQRFGGGHVLDGLALNWTPLGVYHPYGNGTFVNYGKGSAAAIVSSPNFPERYQQGVASAALLGSYNVSISAPDIQTGAVTGADRLDLLTSQNSAFRPVDAGFGFDGALYVSDFASRIIGHAQHPMRDPQWNHTRGRIWRVISKERPVVKDWPAIEGAPLENLLALLVHPQDIVRDHARIQIRALGAQALPQIDAWLSKIPDTAPEKDQARLEALWLMAAQQVSQPQLLAELLKSQDPRFRAAAVQLVRLQADPSGDAEGVLKAAALDPHPRVRMSVLNSVSHLRGREATGAGPEKAALVDKRWAGLLETIDAHEPALQAMLQTLKIGTQPAKGRSVPVLELNPSTRVPHWLSDEAASAQQAEAAPGQNAGKKTKPSAARPARTYLESDQAQTALLSVSHGYLDISLNGVQLLSSDNPYSKQQQVQLDLQKGLNLVEIAFRKIKADAPAVFICDMTGDPLQQVRLAKDPVELQGFEEAWKKAHAADANALRVQAVPNLLQFAPKELRAKAGQPVRIVFENPDLMQHNLVLVAQGADEEVGMLADQMAAQPDGMAKNFIPASTKVLHATPLVNPNGRAELQFNAPKEPGKYGYLCTFPGHWRVMRGVLVVE